MERPRYRTQAPILSLSKYSIVPSALEVSSRKTRSASNAPRLFLSAACALRSVLCGYTRGNSVIEVRALRPAIYLQPLPHGYQVHMIPYGRLPVIRRGSKGHDERSRQGYGSLTSSKMKLCLKSPKIVVATDVGPMPSSPRKHIAGAGTLRARIFRKKVTNYRVKFAAKMGWIPSTPPCAAMAYSGKLDRTQTWEFLLGIAPATSRICLVPHVQCRCIRNSFRR